MNGHVTMSQRNSLSPSTSSSCKYIGTAFLGRKQSSLNCQQSCRKPLLITCRRSNAYTRQDPPVTTGRVCLCACQDASHHTIRLANTTCQVFGLDSCFWLQRSVPAVRQPLRQPPAVREKTLTCSQVVDKQVRALLLLEETSSNHACFTIEKPDLTCTVLIHRSSPEQAACSWALCPISWWTPAQ